MPFQENVLRLLKENGMTKATLAKESGIPYTTLDSMLKRKTDTARLEVIFRMAKALGTSVEALVFEGEEQDLISGEEKRILELYSLLDSRGKNTVLSLLESQADYNREEGEGEFIPVYSAPAAAGKGLPILTEETEQMPVDAAVLPKNALFAVPVSGDSMEPLFRDGDLVYVDPRSPVESGEIGVFLLNGESLLKQYVVKDGAYFLVSLNPRYAPIPILESDELKLSGKVVTK